MSGMTIIIIGCILLILSTAAAAVTEWLFYRKKQKIREQMYHIY